jgi:hypothetical protein
MDNYRSNFRSVVIVYKMLNHPCELEMIKQIILIILKIIIYYYVNFIIGY